MSTEGVMHYFGGQMLFTPLAEWEHDYDIYCKLMKVTLIIMHRDKPH